MSARAHTLDVIMADITLDQARLDALASEFYGVIPAVAGSGAESNAVRIEFHDLTHPDLKTLIKADECIAGLKVALSSFLVSAPDAPPSDPSI